MKARTKAQREVVELTATLPPFDERDLRDARQGFARIYVGARTAWCSCCGSVWESDLWNGRKENDVCPHCGARGKVVKSANKMKSDEKYYVSFIRVVGDWQVIRTAICRRIVEKGDADNIYFSIDEVFQRWMRPETVDVIVGRGVHGLCSWCCDVWNHDSAWTIRKEHFRFELEGDVCGKIQLSKVVRRNGLKSIRRDVGVKDLLWHIIHDDRAEILAKGRQWEMLKHLVSPSKARDVGRWWKEIRVAMRNGYRIKDAGLWLDMVELLSKCGKDVRNPHYICPADLHLAHDAALMMDARRLDRIAAQRADEEKDRKARKVLADADLAARYAERVNRWLDVMIRGKGITIRPLQNIREFYEEGEAMHHCVFTCGYYKKDGILVLTARKAGVRLETIEVDTKRWRILQCRGRFNKESVHHKEIVSLMEKNMSKLRQAI
ncbi:MAG: PcfJ domain-containing protein [Bacteroidaceae bacterium]|nr:PcfJ domain-containing protein [Bacteroidaceae bacterium]